MKLQAIRGMKDVLPPEDKLWRYVEETARATFMAFGFSELRPPIVEHTGLFARAVGQTTDIIEKEMYTFTDRGGESISLRPEATAGVLRAYIENKIYATPGPHRFFTIGPMFRYDRPQKGRLRQFHQLNCEMLDDAGPESDAELIIMVMQLLAKFGLNNVELLLNSLGCQECRPLYRQKLIDFLMPVKDRLCEDCQRRMLLNPLRVLDCKAASCQELTDGAPRLIDHICVACGDHFGGVQRLLALAGVPYRLDSGLVRGLDYYQRTTFEVVSGDLGAQSAVAGGGRYDGLVKTLGGPDQPGMGFAMGMERLMLLLPELAPSGPGLMVAALGEAAYEAMFPLVIKLRAKGFEVDMPSPGRSLKALMRRADKIKAAEVAIVGDSELAEKMVLLKNLANGGQRTVALSDFLDNIEKLFSKVD